MGKRELQRHSITQLVHQQNGLLKFLGNSDFMETYLQLALLYCRLYESGELGREQQPTHWPLVQNTILVELSREEDKKSVLPTYPPRHICDLRCSFEGVAFDMLYYFVEDALRLLDMATDLTDIPLKFYVER